MVNTPIALHYGHRYYCLDTRINCCTAGIKKACSNEQAFQRSYAQIRGERSDGLEPVHTLLELALVVRGSIAVDDSLRGQPIQVSLQLTQELCCIILCRGVSQLLDERAHPATVLTILGATAIRLADSLLG